MTQFFDAFIAFLSTYFNIPIVIFTAFLALFGISGCSYKEGTGGIFDKSEPQKKLSAAYNPWSQTMDWSFFSNDGTGLTATRLYAKSGDKEFEATDVVISDKSVDNRNADAVTLGVQWSGASQLATAHWNGAIGLATAIAPALTEAIKSDPTLLEKPSILRAVVESLAKDAVANGIMPTP